MLAATECAVQQKGDSDKIKTLLVSLKKIKAQNKQVFVSELQVSAEIMLFFLMSVFFLIALVSLSNVRDYRCFEKSWKMKSG
jgi:hypothetical protein